MRVLRVMLEMKPARRRMERILRFLSVVVDGYLLVTRVEGVLEASAEVVSEECLLASVYISEK